jgi:hypothetical protein
MRIMSEAKEKEEKDGCYGCLCILGAFMVLAFVLEIFVFLLSKFRHLLQSL